MNKKLIFLTILFAIATCALCARATRDLEIRYPDFGDITMEVQTVDLFLPSYIRYVFQFIVIIAGFVAFGALVYAGVALLASAGNPSARKQATDQIFAAVIGIAIVLTSYLISRTINPMLVNTIPGIDAAGGITIYSSVNCTADQEGLEKTTISSNILDIEEAHGFKARSLKFNSPPGQLDIIIFPGANYEGGGKQMKNTQGFDCYPLFFTTNSIKLHWQMPGVYLCDTDYQEEDGELFCGGADAVDAQEKLLSYDTALLTNEIENNLGGLRFEQNIKIIGTFTALDAHPGAEETRRQESAKFEIQCNENYHGTYIVTNDYGLCYLEKYGVVLHEDADWTGACEVIRPDPEATSYSDSFTGFASTLQGANPFTGKAPAYPLNNTSSITSFTVREDNQKGGVYLCDKTNPRQTKDPECAGPFTFAMGNLGAGEFSGVNNAGNCMEEWLNADGVSSIIIDGNYLVVLFDGENYTGLCEVFKYSDSNLVDNPIGSCCQVIGPWGRSDCASSAIIIPINGSESTGGWTPTTPTTCGEYQEPSDCFDASCYFNHADQKCLSSIQPCEGESGCFSEGNEKCAEINGDAYLDVSYCRDIPGERKCLEWATSQNPGEQGYHKNYLQCDEFGACDCSGLECKCGIDTPI